MKPTQEQILSALNKLVRENKTELKAEKIELGIIDDLKKDVETARKRVADAERLHKAAEKDDAKLNKLNAEWIDLRAKAEKELKAVKSLIEFGRENIKEAKSLLSKSKKTASTIEQQLKELGLDKKVISSELSEIDQLNSTLKSLDFAFLDDLPF
jgi:predicted  nucleic acid-binding Zn-ribbon protein